MPRIVDSEISDIEEDVTTIKKGRVIHTKESVTKEFDELISFLQEEIDERRKNRDRNSKTGIKFLQGINKRIKTVRAHTLNVMKQRKHKRTGNVNSGFKKPVQISEDLANFTGWNIEEPRSRSDTTSYLCDYIKKNNLQNPENRREILVEKDVKLKKLLKYDSGTDPKPLTYPRLQIYLKHHYSALQPKK